MKREDIDRDAEELFPKLRNFINLNSAPDARSPIYAMLEAIQDRLDVSDCSSEEKGAIITDVIENLIEQNKEELALFKLSRREFFDNKLSTRH